MDLKTEKKCPICQKVKPLSEFHKSRNTSDGHNTYCKKCQVARTTLNRKKRDYEEAYIKHFAEDISLTHEKIADLIRHVIRDMTDELTTTVQYLDLKPSIKAALIAELESTALIKTNQYISQLEKSPIQLHTDKDDSDEKA